MSAYMHPHGYPPHGGQSFRTIPPQAYEHYFHHHPYPYVYPPPPYHYTPPPYPYPYPIYEHHPYATSYVHNRERIEIPTSQEKEESLSFIAESINNRLYQMMKEIDLRCELVPKVIIPTKVEPPPCDNPQPKQPSYTHKPYLYPTSYPNTSYRPPPHFHEGHDAIYHYETPPYTPYHTLTNSYGSPPCEKLPPADDEIKILNEKLGVFIEIAKEDTAKLRAELKGEMKEYLVTLRWKAFH
ncbi:extensin-2-like [Ipomoea triloba]|uniref:extensin-2-like n=1 Tax=Ipomoea triloba TaxID=35885 RepID=UPI00125D1413|nr:extensin-2-like [Ipomoea triloba]